MTCFWNGIMKSLDKEDKIILDIKDRNIYKLISRLKELNCKTENMKWQNQNITNNQIKENMEHIKIYNIHSARNGYLCSTFDPFLFLLSYKLNKIVIFKYCGRNIKYEPENPKDKTLKYKCNTRHFWCN